ncbi:MAG: sigma-70 family RNA polymerase sigma factor [Chloroflexota bacterium]|nr:sigma-70 family RNA polymerase sigma factor [Chloroflexota bacterium]
METDGDLRTDDAHLIAALQRGDEVAFAALIARHHASMVRVAALYVRDREVAEEVAQDAWVAVLRGMDQFEARSSLKTWIFRILTNRARTRGVRDQRVVPFATLQGDDPNSDRSVDPDRFFPAGHEDAGHWSSPPRSWEGAPEARLLTNETGAHIAAAIAALPEGQRTVITLRDVEGWPAAEVCHVLGLTETNQRVLLHRARSRVREALACYLGDA